MKEIKIKDWPDFEAKLQELYNERERLQKENPYQEVSLLLFRGQPSYEWKLESTLERYVKQDVSLSKYYRIILVAKHQIETFTGHTCNIPALDEYEQKANDLDMFFIDNLIRDKDIYSYMAYLRHHGFPSPLLDWMRCPYVAAFFAFDDVTSDYVDVAVYVYLEHAGKNKITSGDLWMRTLGTDVKTHKRHFLQQSNYSVCIKTNGKTAYYGSHEEAFANSADVQDIRWKFIIPAKERIGFLKKLELMNINAYSLFGSEDSLMKTLALHEFMFKK